MNSNTERYKTFETNRPWKEPPLALRGLQQGRFAAKPRAGSKSDSKDGEETDPSMLEVEEKIVKFFATELSNAFGNNIGDQSLFIKVIVAEGIDSSPEFDQNCLFLMTELVGRLGIGG